MTIAACVCSCTACRTLDCYYCTTEKGCGGWPWADLAEKCRELGHWWQEDFAGDETCARCGLEAQP